MIKIPTLRELYDGIVEDLQNELGVTIPRMGKSVLRALAAVQAAKLKLFYLAVGHLQKNIFVDTADSESTGGTLERFGRIKLGRNPFPAQAAQYRLRVTGTSGTLVPASTTFKSNDNAQSPGKLYILDHPYTLQAATDTLVVRALEAGLEARLSVDDELTVTAPLAGLDRIAAVTEETTAPLAAESLEEYRQKAINAYRMEAQGGAATDYRLWAADVQGVKQVYPYARPGASGEIDLYVEQLPESSYDGRGTPTDELLAAVESAIEMDPDTSKPINERGRRPLGVFRVHYLPVAVREVSINIANMDDLSTEIQSVLNNALEVEASKIRPFVSGADVLANRNDILDKNKIIATILRARPGSVFGAVTLKIDEEEVDSYTFTQGEIPYLKPITYVD